MGRFKIIYEPSEVELFEEKCKCILAKLKSLIPIYNVWCIRGSVCSEATLCSNNICDFKIDKLDIINGCSKCQRFQLTDLSYDWLYAKQTHRYGDVIED